MSDPIERQAAIDALDDYILDEVTDSRGDSVREILEQLPAAQQEIVRCGECKHCEHWYADKGRCFLWHEDGISVFEDGFCNYAERRTDEQT